MTLFLFLTEGKGHDSAVSRMSGLMTQLEESCFDKEDAPLYIYWVVLIHTEYSFKQAINTMTIMGGADFSQRCIAQICNKSAGVIFRCTTLRSVRRKAAVAIVICHGTDFLRYPGDLLLIEDCFVCCV